MREKYSAAGVNVSAKDQLIARISPLVEATHDDRVLSGLGHFGGFFDLGFLRDYKHPVLVGCADGVGTKIKLAIKAGSKGLHAVGIDLVAMCVNDLVACGARPLTFLDYYASSALDIDAATHFIAGVAEGCRLAGCALIGGETAQMPGLYTPPDFDAAGFCNGVVERSGILGPDKSEAGLVLLGLASSGLHSNGFSLVRRAIPEPDSEVLDELLTPTRIYVPAILALQAVLGSALRGVANITGGGLYENVPRILNSQVTAVLHHGDWPIPPIIERVSEAAELELKEMYATFNGGLGMVIAVEASRSDEARAALEEAGESVYEVGLTVPRGDDPPLIITGL